MTQPESHPSAKNLLFGPFEPVPAGGYGEHPPRVGFFTDTSICIGCKACEVACKEWNQVPEDGLNFTAMSYDNSGGLGADTWRHVKFVEQAAQLGYQESGVERETGMPRAASATDFASQPVDLGMPLPHLPGAGPDGEQGADGRTAFRWLMASDVCKHCTHAGCLDVCPTGALFRTEFGTVVVQEDICNGCGYCVPACPFGVIDKREEDGRVWKCTLCYDRLRVGQEPACAKACPTKSIQFGPLEELREHARQRVGQLHEAGVTSARLYGDDPQDGVGGMGAFFLLLDEPEVYGLPPDAVVPTRDLPRMWKVATAAAVGFAVSAFVSFLGGRS